MKQRTFKVSKIAAAVAFAIATPATMQLAYAGAGWGDSSNTAPSAAKGSLDAAGNQKVRTFWANSPQGDQLDALTAGTRSTGSALRKFVDPLPGLVLTPTAGQTGISVASPDTSTYTGNDYYEIAVVEYAQRMHSDLAKATTLRGYVQIDPVATDAHAPTSMTVVTAGVSSTVALPPLNNGGVAPTGSLQVPLVQLDGTPVMISRPSTRASAKNGFEQVQAYAATAPNYLGATIIAAQGRPTRIKFYNGLPAGHSGEFTWTVNADGTATQVATPGVWHRNGDLFIPVDRTNPGAGEGPVATKGTRDILCGDTLVGPNNAPVTAGSFCTTANGNGGAMEGFQRVPAYETYTENREELHLHGGDNPWLSDGHPHQWITPAADELGSTGLSAEYRRGELAYNVPDMADPGPGAATYYYPNGQSGRLMFYHDHATGLTRLNVYAGTAAGYLLYDGTENAMFATALGVSQGVPAEGIPLVIQEKTFVPKDIATEDALWNADSNYAPLTTSTGATYTPWGTEGDLWFSHVYETNQDPMSFDGTNPVGRWDGAAFFWPVFPQNYATPDGSYGNASLTPESFMDTPIVNGMAYPTLTVDPKAYRFRILGVGNDRILNLSWYVADSAQSHVDPVTGKTVTDTEVKMVAFSSPNTPLNVTYACPDGTVGLAKGDTTAYGKVEQVGWTETSTQYPTSFPCAGGLMGTGWGQADNRVGGVPDPAAMGPSWLRVGTEGGLLAQPVEIPPTPVNYEYNKRSVTVLNVLERGLWLGPAERADVIVDFSQYAGKTLILYNDSAAPVPAGDPRIDYYTGDGDQTGAGGAPNTVAGFGPNSRTIMQVKVSGTVGTNGTAFNPGTPYVPAVPTGTGAKPAAAATGFYAAAIAAYNATQGKPVIPTVDYLPNQNVAGWTFPTAATAVDPVGPLEHIYTGAIYLNRYQALTFQTPESITYTPAPTCTTTANCLTALTALRANATGGLTTVAAGSTVKAYVESKAIQELFEADYGRMNATLGVELPFTSATIQTTIPLAYVDPATEIIKNGETQFWKITHNGVDSHPVHFHMLNVQVINRMGWDGTIKPIPADEVGWKETLKMHPLEDLIVAVRAKTPATPFGMPHSYRMLSPNQALGDQHGFTQIDPVTGNAPTATSPNAVLQPNGTYVYTNKFVDYESEYVWHCHILGHEENDFMRPFIFKAGETLAGAPTVVTATGVAGNVVVSWVDPTPVITVVMGAPNNEIGFRVERSLNNGAFAALSAGTRNYNAITNSVNALANAISYTDTTVVAPAAPAVPSAPTAKTVTSASVTLTLPAIPANATSFKVSRNGVQVATGVTGATWTDPAVLTEKTAYAYTLVAVGASNSYSYRVAAVTAKGDSMSTVLPASTYVMTAADSAASTALNVTTPALPTLFAATNLASNLVTQTVAGGNLTGGLVQLSFTDNSTGETSYVVEVCRNTCTAATATSTNAGSNNRWYTMPAANVVGTTPVTTGAATLAVNGVTLTNNNVYFRITAKNATATSPVSAISAAMNLNGTPAQPTSVTATSPSAGSVVVSWGDASNNNASFSIQSRYATAFNANGTVRTWSNFTNLATQLVTTGISTSVTLTGAQIGANYAVGRTMQFQVRANGVQGGGGNSNYVASANVVVK